MNRKHTRNSVVASQINRRHMLGLSAAMGAMVAAAALPAAAEAAESDASAPIQQLNAALLGAMKAGNITFAQRFAMLTQPVEQTFDLNAVLQASVGLRWTTLTDDEKAVLKATFRRYTVSSYAASFDSYSGQSFRVLPDTRRLSNGDVIVRTQLIRADGSVTAIDYVMRATAGGWKAVDVLADGSISRVAVQRSDFRALLEGGGVTALQAGLLRKVASLSGGSAA
jgi:phospholipid transport system substrate-binding protein